MMKLKDDVILITVAIYPVMVFFAVVDFKAFWNISIIVITIKHVENKYQLYLVQKLTLVLPILIATLKCKKVWNLTMN